MKALEYDAGQGLRLVQMAEPTPRHDEVRVRVLAVGVCGSDLSWFRGGLPQVPTPVVPGHEIAGRLDDGRQVVINPMVGCGQCSRCKAGNTHLCAKRQLIGITRAGGYAEQLVAPERNLIEADHLTLTQAALVEPIANGVHAWRRAGLPRGRVAIIGAGSIGMCLLHVLRSEGLDDITVIDPVDARRDAARQAGAVATATRLEGEFDAVFDAAGTRSTRIDAVNATAYGGTVALLGLHDDELRLSAASLIVTDRTVAGCFGYSESAFRRAVELASTIEAPWARAFDIDEAPTVLASLINGQGAPGTIKTMIRFAH